ncbi:mgtC family protein, partial [Yersinia pestis PY-07]
MPKDNGVSVWQGFA